MSVWWLVNEHPSHLRLRVPEEANENNGTTWNAGHDSPRCDGDCSLRFQLFCSWQRGGIHSALTSTLQVHRQCLLSNGWPTDCLSVRCVRVFVCVTLSCWQSEIKKGSRATSSVVLSFVSCYRELWDGLTTECAVHLLLAAVLQYSPA